VQEDMRIARWIEKWHLGLMPILPTEGVVLRPARPEDDADLIRLAALDSARPLPGPALVAERSGAIVAALCLSTGRAVADPFVPSAHLVALLRHHAARRPTRRRLPRLVLRPA
jgi:hypothetical protein